MTKRISIIALFCLLLTYAHAETIFLRTGVRVKGEIVFQNEEVVIVRDASGARMQYPRADVESIRSDETAEKNSTEDPANDQMVNDQMVNKKASILLELAGGAAMNPNGGIGGGVSADLIIGSHHIGDRHILIGGGVGYHGMILLDIFEPAVVVYNFIPVQVTVRMPLIEQKHAPVFGASLGYGIAMSKDYLGGLYTGIDFGYRYQLNPRTAIGAVAYAQIQQATVPVKTTIEENEFVNTVGRNLFAFGYKFTFYF